MTPEADIGRVIAGVCPQSGHWPYTRAAGLYIGYRPAEESFQIAGDRIARAMVRYDIVICAARGEAAARMEEMRYRLYAALLAAGWRFDGAPGPESYSETHDLFLWPVTVIKGFMIDKNGQPAAPGNKSGGDA